MHENFDRHYNIDLIRILACIAVIGLHTYGIEIGLPNSIVYYLCGFAVPCFLCQVVIFY